MSTSPLQEAIDLRRELEVANRECQQLGLDFIEKLGVTPRQFYSMNSDASELQSSSAKALTDEIMKRDHVNEKNRIRLKKMLESLTLADREEFGPHDWSQTAPKDEIE
jgi:hypothetical protein